MSNEKIMKAADAVDTLREALELWCTRDTAAGSPLGVRGAADDASAAAGAAIAELIKLRDQVEREALAYDQAGRARTDALLGEILIKPLQAAALAPGTDWSTTYYCLGCGVVVIGHERCGDPTRPECAKTADYKCGDCGKVFPVDPADPIESHGAYLDHIAEHDDDAEAGQ